MKELTRFLKKHQKKIFDGITLLLMLATIGMALLYMISDSMDASKIFFVAALLMLDLALNYFRQKKKSKGVYLFYTLAAVGCIAVGIVLRMMPVVE